MSDDPRLIDLLLRWDESVELGRELSPTELCPDDDALRAELSRSIDAQRRMIDLFGGETRGLARDAEGRAEEPRTGAGTTVGLDAPRSSDGPIDLGFLAPAERSSDLGRLDKYHVEAVLGSGGMGAVLLGFDPDLERHIALKVMLPHIARNESARVRFLREARAAARLRSDYIVTVHHVGEDRGVPFFVMERMEGESLESALSRRPDISIDEAIRIARDVCRGLVDAHEQGVIHRDIKPGNLWLDSAQADRARILDFGLTRTTDGPIVTASDAIVGTPAYMSPEQSMGQEIDARSDLFSFGCVLYRMLVGRNPFRGSSAVATLLAIARDQPDPPSRVKPGVPRELSDLTMSLLRKLPADRPASARAVLTMLERLGPNATSTPGPRRRRGLAVSLAVVIVLIGVLFWPRDRVEPTIEPLVPASTAQSLPPKVEPAAITTPAPIQRPIPPPPVARPIEPRVNPPSFTNALGMAFRLVPKGTARLADRVRRDGVREVDMPRDFYLGVHEVTQAQWRAVMDKNPSDHSRTGRYKAKVADLSDEEIDRLPVDNVDQASCREFLERLNAAAPERSWFYRLPTPEEWEYACRGGPDAPAQLWKFYFRSPSNEPDPTEANLGKIPFGRSTFVGSYPPNRLGLFDMHGNVAELCQSYRGVMEAFGGSHVHSPLYGAVGVRLRDTARSAHGLRLARVPLGADAMSVDPLGMAFVTIPPGRARLPGLGTTVEVAAEIQLGAYEVTRGQWNAMMSDRVGSPKSPKGLDPSESNQPIYDVTLADIHEFVRRVNERVKDPDWFYRLPTQAEWEYACRGGPYQTRASFAADFHAGEPGSALAVEQARIAVDGRPSGVVPVGLHPPNPLGLFDMHGNVAEWCEDRPKGSTWRGGSHASRPEDCAAATSKQPLGPVADVGFRLARIPFGLATRHIDELGIEFVLVPKGAAWLGGGKGIGGNAVRQQTFALDFYMGVYEITQSQWERVMGTNPSQFAKTGARRDKLTGFSAAEVQRFPVDSISWKDANEFVRRLNEQSIDKDWLYRLPSAAEWEYACRGGPFQDRATYVDWDFYSWMPFNNLLNSNANIAGNELGRTTSVGSYVPNRLGLHDMHGNVAEWCRDLEPLKFGSKIMGPATRGGSWNSKSNECKAGVSTVTLPTAAADSTQGLRLVRVHR